MWISVFMSHFSCSLQESSWESRSYHDPTRQIVWIGLPLCINSFPRKLPNECWPIYICCPKSITRKANTVENNILWIVDCSSTSKYKLLINCSRKWSNILGLWEPFKQNPPHSQCLHFGFFHSSHSSEKCATLLGWIKWKLIGRDEMIGWKRWN